MLQAAQHGCVVCVKSYVCKGGCVLKDGRRLTVWDGSRNHRMWNAWKATLEGGVAGNQSGQEAVRRYLSGLPDAEGHIAETEEYWSKRGYPNPDYCHEKWFSKRDCWSRQPSDETVPMSGVWADPSEGCNPEVDKGVMPSTGDTVELGNRDGPCGSRTCSEMRGSDSGMRKWVSGGMPRNAHDLMPSADKETEQRRPEGDDSIREFHRLCRRGDLDSIKSAMGSDCWCAPWWLFTTSEVRPGLWVRASEYAWIGYCSAECGLEAFRFLELMEHTVLMEYAMRERLG